MDSSVRWNDTGEFLFSCGALVFLDSRLRGNDNIDYSYVATIPGLSLHDYGLQTGMTQETLRKNKIND
ncbi:MAG: hypothetical protein V3V99_07355 [candidate division Zixibacteria bacterium]